MNSHAGDVHRGDGFHFLPTRLGEMREKASSIRLALDPLDQAANRQLIDLIGQTAAGTHDHLGDFGHPELSVRCFREQRQHFEICEIQSMNSELVREPVSERSLKAEKQSPRVLLLLSQPLGIHHLRDTTDHSAFGSSLPESPRCNPTAVDVIVDQTGRLHEGVHRRRPDKAEPPALELLGECNRLRTGDGEFVAFGPSSHPRGRLKRPAQRVEGLARIQKGDRCPRVVDRRDDLGPIPDDSGVGHQQLDVPIVERRNHIGVKSFEDLAIPGSLSQDGDPRQTGLSALQAQFLEDLGFPVKGPAPFLIVVRHVEIVGAAPPAPLFGVGAGEQIAMHDGRRYAAFCPLPTRPTIRFGGRRVARVSSRFMSHTSDQRFLVLHGCKLKGFSEPSAIAPVIGIKPPVVTKILQGLVKEGLAKYLEGGRISGYALTPAGKEEQVRLAAVDLAESGSRSVVEDSYERFLVLNTDLLAVCTAWQVRDLDRNILNDHSDRDYDSGVIKRLADVHVGVTPITVVLSGALDRYHHYQPRLQMALDKVKKGNHEWFAKPILDSYHTVWMELHEDLLSTLRIERASEDA